MFSAENHVPSHILSATWKFGSRVIHSPSLPQGPGRRRALCSPLRLLLLKTALPEARPLLLPLDRGYHMASLGKHGVVAELSFAKRGQSTPLTAISLSSDQRHAVVGGHGIMKVHLDACVFPSYQRFEFFIQKIHRSHAVQQQFCDGYFSAPAVGYKSTRFATADSKHLAAVVSAYISVERLVQDEHHYSDAWRCKTVPSLFRPGCKHPLAAISTYVQKSR